MRDKKVINEKMQELVKLTASFCDKYLNKEYKMLTEKLIKKMARKRNVPFLYGKLEVWAAGVIYALGQINFLFSKETKPYVSALDICSYFGVSQSSVQRRAKQIREMFKMRYWDPEFSTEDMKQRMPLSELGLTIIKKGVRPSSIEELKKLELAAMFMQLYELFLEELEEELKEYEEIEEIENID